MQASAGNSKTLVRKDTGDKVCDVYPSEVKGQFLTKGMGSIILVNVISGKNVQFEDLKSGEIFQLVAGAVEYPSLVQVQ
jgi:hypothetical protein